MKDVKKYKTGIQWLKTIEDKDVRSKALTNCTKNSGVKLYSSLSKTLRVAFIWDFSPEGYKYWNKITNKIIKQGK